MQSCVPGPLPLPTMTTPTHLSSQPLRCVAVPSFHPGPSNHLQTSSRTEPFPAHVRTALSRNVNHHPTVFHRHPHPRAETEKPFPSYVSHPPSSTPRKMSKTGLFKGKRWRVFARSASIGEPEVVDCENDRATPVGWYRDANRLWNLPNVLTLMRVLLIPPFAIGFYLPSHGNLISGSIFILAAITDFWDGYLARKWNICSNFGAFLDPVADKLMVSTALVLLAGQEGLLIAVPSTMILAREIAVSALREWMAEKGKRGSVAVGWSGKVKTAFQMVSLTGLLYTSRVLETSTIHLISLVLLYVSTYLTISSGLKYFNAAWPVLSGREAD